MIEGGKGGANTQTGLRFEKDTDLRSALVLNGGVNVQGTKVFFNGELTGYLLQKHDLYRSFLQARGVQWADYISKQLLPDEAYFSIPANTLFVVEKKFQQVAGSVDEKLQTCGFKKLQYEKLCRPINVGVEYIYVLNDWFRHPSYADVLAYIESVGCHYYFNELPVELFKLTDVSKTRRLATSR